MEAGKRRVQMRNNGLPASAAAESGGALRDCSHELLQREMKSSVCWCQSLLNIIISSGKKGVLAEVFSLSVFIYQNKCCCIYSTGDLTDSCTMQCPQAAP